MQGAFVLRPDGTVLLTLQLFASLCEPLLYSRIYTDQLPLLLHEARRPAMYRRFAKTKSLYIEYCPKGLDTSYQKLVETGKGWLKVGMDAKQVEKVEMEECETEAQAILAVLSPISRMGVGRIFPRLETIAVASVYGREPDLWHRYAYGRETVTAGMYGMVQFNTFIAAGKLRHVGLRNSEGPLSISPILNESERDPMSINFGLTCHFSAAVHQLVIVCGRPMVWACDAPTTTPWVDVLGALGKQVLSTASSRQESRERHGFCPDTADIDLYCSTATYPSQTDNPIARQWASQLTGGGSKETALTVAEQRRMTDKMSQAITKTFKEESRLADSIRCHPSVDTPICPACGMGPPE